jgi:hypothetical protein
MGRMAIGKHLILYVIRTSAEGADTDPDVQDSRVRFFMEEFRSRRCSDGRSGQMGLRATEDTGSRFVAFVDGLVSVIGHADRAGPLWDYCTGLVMPCERKRVEPMAAMTAPANVGAQHQSLLHFVGG